ncbi:MAG: adenylate/guanylate cyclase domain-containing protein [Usitatibacter sp.]
MNVRQDKVTERRIRPTRLQDRIVVFFVVLLMAVQLVSFYAIRHAISHTAQSSLREELRVGSRVLVRFIDQRGGAIDEAAARQLQGLTNADVSFVRASGTPPGLVATTLPPARRAVRLAAAPALVATARAGATARLGDEDYEVLATPVDAAGQQPVHAILQRATADGLAAYLLLEAVLLVIAGFSLVVTLAGAIHIARRITRPVAQLGDAAREIERGNYSVRIGGEASDEIGELGRAFDRMATGLAERDNMRDILGKVASNEVVARLLEGGDIELGGEERDVTVMFTDIRNFTAIVERLTPDQSLQLLNQFLTVISEVIEEHGGVVDKYLGDGVMALFGAPVTREDDAQRALECALGIRRRVEALGPSLASRGLPHPQIGIGINTSRVVAGNIGSPSRLNYTVLGDGVNLAARLEGLTKRYHVPIVVGHATREKVRGVVFRELDKVRVRGKTVPERIFEPLAHEGGLTPAQLVSLAQWHDALEMYRLRCWDVAAAGFGDLAPLPGYERITQIYLGYIRDLEANPPGEGWDAAFTLYEK